ncbi:MAG: putative RpiR family transcriptional regulator, partial [Glaciihabitans sp.]|nr:putative RpiR family transcriptional regulator [Glaciihabitans sp.]
SARLLQPGDVCLAVSDSGMNSTTVRTAEAAAAAGVVIIGVTSYARSRLSDLATHALVAGATFHAWGDGAVTGNITQTLILSALQDAVAREMEGSAEAGPVVLEEVMGIVQSDE